MNIVIAIDSFKGSLSSLEAGRAAETGIRRVYPDAEIAVYPVADGGEGTVDALASGLGGERRVVRVTGPLGVPVDAAYAVLPDRTAVIEIAAAAGLPLVAPDEQDPLITTTYGVGEMIADAITIGCRRFVIGIGGSATNDGGVGMLQALGFVFSDENGHPVPFGANGLAALRSIDTAPAMPELAECEFRVACDVTNPLCGPNGCSAVYAPQKGARTVDIARMDTWLGRYAALAKTCCPQADGDAAGAGAAGGLGFALRTFLNATLENGIALVLSAIGLEAAIKQADIVITGEGRLDAQTAMGKAPCGIAQLAKRHQKPVLAFAGGVTKEASACHAAGIDAFFPVVRGICTKDEAMARDAAFDNLADAAQEVFRVIRDVRYGG